MPIDAFVDRHNIARVEAIKLDIEGMEAEALAGASNVLRNTRPMIALEFLHRCTGRLRAGGDAVRRACAALGAWDVQRAGCLLTGE